MSRSRKISLGLLIGTAILISGCGQKGPLYLPGQKDANLQTQPTLSPIATVTIQKIS